MSKQVSENQMQLQQLLDHLANEAIRKPSELTETLTDLPAGVAAALNSGRGSLASLERPRELSREECAALIRVIAVLIDSNTALQEHAQKVGDLVTLWMSAFKGMQSLAERVNDFANFRSLDHG